MKGKEMANFIDQFEKNPEMDIPASFLEQLRLYEKYVEEYDIKLITKDFDFIPKNIEKIINNPFLCAEIQVCELVTNVLFKFITVRGVADQPAIWASKQLKKMTIQKETIENLMLPTKLSLKAIRLYPKEYTKSLSNKSLNIISLSNPPHFLVLPLLEEFDKRDLEIPSNLLNLLDFNNPNISPHLFLSIFDIYIKEPSTFLSEQIVSAFKIRPQLHLMVTHDLSNYDMNAVDYALQTLGTTISNFLPLPFPLSSLYSPKILDLVDEIEAFIRDPNQCDKNVILSILQSYSESDISFTLPLLIEFPQWQNFLKDLDERFQLII